VGQSRGPGYQLVRVGDLGELRVHDDRDLAPGDEVVVYADRIGWAGPSDGTSDLTWLGYGKSR
jgi:hypothetical protein